MDMSKTIRVLSDAALISSLSFGKITPAEQTAVLATAAGKPLVFVDNFQSLRDRRKLIAKLLAGENVQQLLEFNEVELTPEEFALIGKVSPILEKIQGAIGSYPWLEEKDFSDVVQFNSTRLRRNSYNIGLKAAKTIWETASAFWAGGDMPKPKSLSADGYSRTVSYGQEGVTIGCQSMTRQEVEFIARKMGWEPNA